MSDRNFGLLCVTGVGRVTATPDKAVITFSVSASSEKSQSQSVGAQADRLYNVKAALVTARIIESMIAHKNLNTTSYGFAPEYKWNADRTEQVLRGYKTSQILSLTVPRENASKVVDIVAEKGGELNGVTFVISGLAGLHREATRLAIEDAKRNALDGAIILGVHLDLTRVHDYSEGSGNEGRYNGGMRAMAVCESAAPDLAVGETDVTATVSISYVLA